jgi:hypothetical protein
MDITSRDTYSNIIFFQFHIKYHKFQVLFNLQLALYLNVEINLFSNFDEI